MQVVMGPGSNILTWVGSIFAAKVRSVNHNWFGFGFGKFPQKISNFSVFSLRIKKILSGQVKKYPGQGTFGLLFTAG